MTSAEQALLAKARRGEHITVEDKLAVITDAADVEWFKIGLRDQGALTDDAAAACARRKVEIQRGRG